ncbi:ATP12 family chaperone protein [Sphingomonas bacterium]|uniref:ATP12 family chaperone protein n=1 Tax=Sphingomonas bacterium TaxID=1895847 RepID=UPI001575935E|nr:ATP12 family protein [Sphingomonas bacterium]
MKRFWTAVTVTPDRGVALDGRPVRTPGRMPLLMPTDKLADAVADEWRAVADAIDPRAMPLTGMANAAIDRIAPDPAIFAAGLAKYGESDLLYYRAATPDLLAARQAAAWDPLLDWARTRYDVHFETVAGVMHRPQPAATIERLHGAVAAQSPFALAALSPIVTLTGSLVAALALLEGAADAGTAWTAAMVDELWSVEMWGEDALATADRAGRREGYDAAVRMLGYLG